MRRQKRHGTRIRVSWSLQPAAVRGRTDVQSAAATITADLPAVSSDQMAVTEEFHQDLVRVMDEPSRMSVP